MKTSSLFGIAAGAVMLAATPLSLHWSATPLPSVSLDKADARVGRPLTPMSVAGVHRRAYRRGAYGYGAAGVGLGLGAAALTAGAIANSAYYGNSGYGSPYYGYSGYSSPYYGNSGYSSAYYGSSYPYSGSYGYSGYAPAAGYGGSYAYYGSPGYYRPHIYRPFAWRNW
jgi:hypothetical protein